MEGVLGDSIMNCSVEHSDGISTGVEGITIGSISSHYYEHIDESHFHNWIQPYYAYSYPEDKTRQAFRIVKALMKKKMVKLDKVEDFVMLVDEILEIL